MTEINNGVIRGTKKLMRRDLSGLKLSRIMLQGRNGDAEWRKFHNALYENALILLRELYRMNGDYHPISEKEVLLDIKDKDQEITFIFATSKAHVKFLYKQTDDYTFTLEDIEEEVYEDVIALF